jgi:hypothetical protein
MRITLTIIGKDAAKAVRELQSTIEYDRLAATVKVVAKVPERQTFPYATARGRVEAAKDRERRRSAPVRDV